ncbi:hypothetical protein B0J12DRAFT_660764 [Macrophomina phaseolina]|uniref:DNA repair protein Rad26 n=1 Tax=Macrophomina phaseolina TaxID=35725 RepID=A0ABQ8GFW1_9PEZI|nr:hypothetical protein B0J12DRAFT_660764 [Macrophomina phaseolina]
MASDRDEYGWDDGLDDLPDDALREAETQALLSTQRRDQSRAPPSASAHATQAPLHGDPPSSDYAHDADEIQLNGETVAPGPPKTTPAGPSSRLGANNPTRNHTNTRRTFQDLAADPSQGPYSHRLARYGSNSNYNISRPSAAPSQAAPSWADAGPDELRRRIQDLEASIADLVRAKDHAETQARAKAGEVTIVRTNWEKANKEHAVTVARMLQAHTNDTQMLTEKLNAQKKLLERIESENKFLEQEVKVEAGKAKHAQRTLKDGVPNGNATKGQAPATTPKKNRIAPFGDGFDDGDVVMVSPSKSRDKSRAGTPKNGSKRKRNAMEASPSKPLPLMEVQAAEERIVAPPDIDLEEDVSVGTGKDDQKFRILKRLMNHRPAGVRERTFEAFTKHAFPSSPRRLLSSIIYDGISLYRDESDDFVTHFCRILFSLWGRCAQENYWVPLHLIIDTLQFILAFEPLEKTTLLADEIVPLAQSSALLVAWAPLDDTTLKQHIDLQECLSLLLTLARSCAHDEESIARFWTQISRDFVRAVLKSQSLSTLTLMLELLATSVTSTSFGPIPDFSASEPPPDLNHSLPNDPVTLVDHLTLFLHSLPNPAPRSAFPAPSRPALWTFRLNVLRTISSFLPSPAAATALARHRYFLGRLLHLLNRALSSLYSTAPRTPLAGTLSRIVNLTTRIAYSLMMDETTKPLIDRKEKLNAVPGTTHAHLVALTRVAMVDTDDAVVEPEQSVGVGYGSFSAPPPSVFASGVRVLEAGIEEEVVEMAHALLDEFLSPEEGEELVKVFSTARTTA